MLRNFTIDVTNSVISVCLVTRPFLPNKLKYKTKIFIIKVLSKYVRIQLNISCSKKEYGILALLDKKQVNLRASEKTKLL